MNFLEQGDVLRYRLRAWSSEQAENAWDNVKYLRKIPMSYKEAAR